MPSNVVDQMSVSATIQNGFSYYFRDFLNKVQAISEDLSEDEFWTNPYPYGNSIGHLVLHITGNLNFYIGKQLADTGYIRDREREFTEQNPPRKADAIQQLKLAVETVIATLEKQTDNDWAMSYSAEGVDDVPDRFSMFLRCAVHFHHHIGHMSYTTHTFWDKSTSPEAIGRRVIEDIFTRADFMMYDYNNSIAVHYAEVCTGFGAAQLAGLLKDSDILSRLSERYMKVITDNIPNTANHVDVNVYGILALELYTQTKNQIFLKQGLELADIQWEDPLPNGMTKQTRFWVDDIWMIGSLQVQAYRVTGNLVYLERAALELDAYVQRLQQPNGLYFHGEDGLFYWGRGNGWAAAGLAELLSELPEENSHHASILAGYRKMMNALLRYQSEDGMWRQLVDHEEAWKETSSTGMFGYAMAMGVKAGFLPQEDFKAAYQKAWLALTRYVTNEGKVTDVCVGTGQGQSVEYYLERPRITGDFHGQAPVLWFAHCLLTMQGQ